jgi:hypothetical protein
MIYAFDIDGTLGSGGAGDYSTHVPYPNRIKTVNDLYSAGHTIYLFTARGSTTGIDWKEFTEQQMREWGVQYHKLILGKPEFDLLIDDKCINSELFWRNQ